MRQDILPRGWCCTVNERMRKQLLAEAWRKLQGSTAGYRHWPAILCPFTQISEIYNLQHFSGCGCACGEKDTHFEYGRVLLRELSLLCAK